MMEGQEEEKEEEDEDDADCQQKKRTPHRNLGRKCARFI